MERGTMSDTLSDMSDTLSYMMLMPMERENG